MTITGFFFRYTVIYYVVTEYRGKVNDNLKSFSLFEIMRDNQKHGIIKRIRTRNVLG